MSIHQLPRARSIPELFTDVVKQVTNLTQKEFKLARAEISENLSGIAVGLGLIVGGAVLLIPALVILLEAAVQAIERAGLAPLWSALIVGGVVFALGLILLLVGTSRLKPENLMPNKTIEQLRQDASMATEHMKPTEGARSNNGTQRAA